MVAPALAVGQRVIAESLPGKEASGVVEAVSADGLYDIRYDDGFCRHAVRREKIRHEPSWQPPREQGPRHSNTEQVSPSQSPQHEAQGRSGYPKTAGKGDGAAVNPGWVLRLHSGAEEPAAAPPAFELQPDSNGLLRVGRAVQARELWEQLLPIEEARITVSREHFEIRNTGPLGRPGALLLTNLSRRGTRLNGVVVQGEAALKFGDVLGFGLAGGVHAAESSAVAISFRLVESPAMAEQATCKRVEVQLSLVACQTGDGVATMAVPLPADGSPLRVGRNFQAPALWEALAPDAALRGSISREHFEVALAPLPGGGTSGRDAEPALMLTCLSALGVLHNGERLPQGQSRVLVLGDIIAIPRPHEAGPGEPIVHFQLAPPLGQEHLPPVPSPHWASAVPVEAPRHAAERKAQERPLPQTSALRTAPHMLSESPRHAAEQKVQERPSPPKQGPHPAPHDAIVAEAPRHAAEQNVQERPSPPKPAPHPVPHDAIVADAPRQAAERKGPAPAATVQHMATFAIDEAPRFGGEPGALPMVRVADDVGSSAAEVVRISIGTLPPPFSIECVATAPGAISPAELGHLPREARVIEASVSNAELRLGRNVQPASFWAALVPEEELRITISREQFGITIGDDGFMCLRNFSSAGTLVNGRRIHQEVRVEHGDAIGVGGPPQGTGAALLFQLSTFDPEVPSSGVEVSSPELPPTVLNAEPYGPSLTRHA